SPPASSASTSAATTPTISNGCHLRHPESPPARPRQVRAEGLSRLRTRAASQPTPTPAVPTLNVAYAPPHPETACRSTRRRRHAEGRGLQAAGRGVRTAGRLGARCLLRAQAGRRDRWPARHRSQLSVATCTGPTVDA